MSRKAIPKVPTGHVPVVGKRLLAVDVQVVHHQMNRARGGIADRQIGNNLSELRRRPGWCRFGEVPAGLGLNSTKDIGCATALVFAIPFGDLAGCRSLGRSYVRSPLPGPEEILTYAALPEGHELRTACAQLGRPAFPLSSLARHSPAFRCAFSLISSACRAIPSPTRALF
jgi:hypothetical protein